MAQKAGNVSAGGAWTGCILFLLAACEAGGELDAPPPTPQPKVVVRDGAVELSWTPVANANRYHVYSRPAAEAAAPLTQVADVDVPHVVISDLDNGAVYVFTVTAVNAGGEGSPSSALIAAPQPPPVAPAVTAATPGNESVTVAWEDIADADFYTVYLARSAALRKDNVQHLPGWIVREQVTSPFTQTGLLNGAEYFLFVTASNSSGESPASALLSSTPSAFQSLSVGANHNCVLDASSRLWCWGANGSGQLGDGAPSTPIRPQLVESAHRWRTVATADDYTCGIRGDNSLWCWGSNLSGQLGHETLGSSYNAGLIAANGPWANVGVGGEASCATKLDGELWCWGALSSVWPKNNHGFAQLGSGQAWQRPVVTADHICGDDGTGILTCWSRSTTAQPDVPRWRWLASNDAIDRTHICAIDASDDSAWCWHTTSPGRAAVGTDIDEKEEPPQRVPSDEKWQAVGVGRDHACGIQQDASLWCWGNNDIGQLGIDAPGSVPTPIKVSDEHVWQAVGAGVSHTCAMQQNGRVWCTGSNEHGQLGLGVQPHRDHPTEVLRDARTIVTFGNQSCATLADGALWCWGRSWAWQPGDELPSHVPIPLASPVPLVNVVANKRIHCALSVEQSIYCWGAREYPTADKAFLLATSSGWQRLAFGGSLCALRNDSTLWCWNGFPAGEPNQISDRTDWASIVGGYNHTCALTQGGEMGCWGNNDGGQLGTGDFTSRDTLEQVGAGRHWAQISAGHTHTCAIATDQSLWCWGDNSFGQLGDDTDTRRPTPNRVDTAQDWAFVDAGAFRSCAIKSDKSLWCWGYLIKSTTDGVMPQLRTVRSPLRVGSDNDWLTVDSGERHSCALKTDGRVYCWGMNDVGQIGDGTAWRNDWQQVQFPNP